MARRRECLLAKPSRAPKDPRVSLSIHRIAWLTGSTALVLAAATVPATAQTALPNSNLPLLLQNFPGGNPSR